MCMGRRKSQELSIERTAGGEDREASLRVSELRPTLSDWRRDTEPHIQPPAFGGLWGYSTVRAKKGPDQ